MKTYRMSYTFEEGAVREHLPEALEHLLAGKIFLFEGEGFSLSGGTLERRGVLPIFFWPPYFGEKEGLPLRWVIL